MAFDASENSGVTCFQNGGLTYGNFGTSLSSPCWAGLIAIANQGRVADGGTTLNSGSNPTQALQALYSLPAGDFHDITSGYNGFSAGPGYDEVTGLGSPIANLLIPGLVSYGVATQLGRLVITVQPPASVAAGSAFGLTVAVEDSSGNVITNYDASVAIALATTPAAPARRPADGAGHQWCRHLLRLDAEQARHRLYAQAAAAASPPPRPAASGSSGSRSSGWWSPREPTSGVTAGSEFGLTVEADDQFGDVATSYTGGVTDALAGGPRMSWSMLA